MAIDEAGEIHAFWREASQIAAPVGQKEWVRRRPLEQPGESVGILQAEQGTVLVRDQIAQALDSAGQTPLPTPAHQMFHRRAQRAEGLGIDHPPAGMHGSAPASQFIDLSPG